jgi:hypothetical protein
MSNECGGVAVVDLILSHSFDQLESSLPAGQRNRYVGSAERIRRAFETSSNFSSRCADHGNRGWSLLRQWGSSLWVEVVVEAEITPGANTTPGQ